MKQTTEKEKKKKRERTNEAVEKKIRNIDLGDSLWIFYSFWKITRSNPQSSAVSPRLDKQLERICAFSRRQLFPRNHLVQRNARA